MVRNMGLGVAAVGLMGVVSVMGGACTGSTSSSTTTEPAPAPVQAEPEPAGPSPTLIMVQAQFPGGKPGPAKAVLYHLRDGTWTPEVVEDPASNVWHKGQAWRDGFLTLGAQKALLKHWTRGEDGKFTAKTLWEVAFGGKFDRLRDLEFADLDGDGAEEMAIVTHDMGVVAVGNENEDGSWTFEEYDKTPDTIVHEVEVGDVDGDGKVEFYVTPSARNKASGESQPGGVYRYDHQEDGSYARSEVIRWDESHAKEILVHDVDGDGKPELYVAKEGHVVKEGGDKVLKSPAAIYRMAPGANGVWTETLVAELTGEKQCRFMVGGDVNHDGKVDLVASGMETGLWLIQGSDTGYTSEVFFEDSGGFDHPTHVADLDNDGKLEVYAASEKRDFRLLRRFDFDGEAFKAQVIAPIPSKHITWNLMDGTL